MRSRAIYAALALLIFCLEVGIAAFLDDRLIRPFVGDNLAVVLVYLVLRAATKLRRGGAAAAAFGFAVAVELSQLARLGELLGLAGNSVAQLVLGAEFDPLDLIAYATGAAFVLLVDRSRRDWGAPPPVTPP